MAPKIIPLDFPEVKLLRPPLFTDSRGYVSELFRADWFKREVADVDFIQENQSKSDHIGTLRGLHFQSPPYAQGKLVQCVSGAIFDVIVDIRPNSGSFGRWISINMHFENTELLWIPPGFAHGFCTLLKNTVVNYKLTGYFKPEHSVGIAWNDPEIAVEWPSEIDISRLSEKDTSLPLLSAAAHLLLNDADKDP